MPRSGGRPEAYAAVNPPGSRQGCATGTGWSVTVIAGAGAAVWLALATQADVGSVALAAPDGPPDEAFREMQLPVLVLAGTKEGSDAGDRYRTLLPDCHFMFVYDAGRAIGAERPAALAFIALEFFERRDLFRVSRESGVAFP